MAVRQFRLVFEDGKNRVISGRTALVILKILRYEDAINDAELRCKFLIHVAPTPSKTGVEATLDVELTA